MSDEKKNTIGGTVTGQADLAQGSVRTEAEKKPQPGALVEDETLAGTTDGGVVPKDPAGQATEGEATDPRERPSS